MAKAVVVRGVREGYRYTCGQILHEISKRNLSSARDMDSAESRHQSTLTSGAIVVTLHELNATCHLRLETIQTAPQQGRYSLRDV